MSAAMMPPPPAVPPRPSRSQDKDGSLGSHPKVPPRPINRRLERSVSPNPERFAPSPLNESPFSKSPKATRFSASAYGLDAPADPIHRPGSVSMPSVGEEGTEYAAMADEIAASPPSSPEQTRTVANDLKLHAPKPSLPAQSAKQRVMAVTRTDSDKAASYGIGRPSSEEPAPSKNSIKKKPSTSQLSTNGSHYDDEEHGIPEIGQRVPMYPNAGDVQAPSPALGGSFPEGAKSSTPRHHNRKHSARGFVDLPPGSYGLHGHGHQQPTDKLEKAWYDKHPDSLKRECSVPLHDRQNDFAMSSTELNKIVRETHSRGSGLGTSAAAGTPSEEIGYQATEEYTSRISSPRPASAAPKSPKRVSHPDISVSPPLQEESGVIHVEDPRRRSVAFSEEESGNHTEPEPEESGYSAPILASDEVAKDPLPYEYYPAVAPPRERRGSAYEIEEPSSRPTSRPASIYNNHSQVELVPTPLEDVDEYEPLFPEEKEAKKAAEAEGVKWKPRHKFPSKDVWEDAPNSVHYTTEVSTEEQVEDQPKPRSADKAQPRAETPAHAFARQQEALAEQESRNKERSGVKSPRPMFLPLQQIKSNEARPSAQRFPSRDIWEDAPESHLQETTVETPEISEDSSPVGSKPPPVIPARPQKKLSDPKAAADRPAVPERPKPRQLSSDDALRPRPVVADKPKPQVPARPTKTLPSGIDSKEQDALPRQKPAVPVRPVGGKIAALQAGFMSDLNKRLQLGPQQPKKEEPPAADTVEEQEKAPLVDARKGRARGPQRRAPAKSPSPAAADGKSHGPTLSFSPLRFSWSIGPEGSLTIHDASEPEAAEPAKAAEEPAEAVVPKVDAPSGPAAAEADEPAEEEEEVTAADDEVPAPDAPKAPEAVSEEPKTLASNMAGETVVEATVKEAGNKVEPVDVKETAKE